MAEQDWTNEMVMIVRHLIGDVDDHSYTYLDTRLETTILTAAQLVQSKHSFDKTYTIEIDECSLTPDPTAATKDNSFINLVCLKAACIITGSEWRTKANIGIKIVDGPSSIDTGSQVFALQAIHKDLCAQYSAEELNHQMGVSGHIILSPYSPGSHANSRTRHSQR